MDEEVPVAAVEAAGGPAQGSFDFDGGPRGPLTVAAWAGDEVLVSEAETLAAFSMARGERPVVAHDWKTIAMADDACAAPPLEHDTMVAAYLIDPARRGYPLDELATEAGLGARVKANGARPAEPGASAKHGSDGAAERAVLTRLLAERQRERLDEDGLTDLFHEIELPLVDVLVEMERVGIKLDVERLRAISARFNERAVELERRVWDLAGEEFTIGSPQQLAPILFEKLGLSRKRRGKTGFSTDARVLQAIRHEHEIVPAIEEWREVTKLKSTYLDAFPELIGADGRLHTTFNQTAATTGRLSSTNPNLQNIPIRTEQGREIRACFVAEDGHAADLGRLLAGRAAAARAHRRRAGAEGDLPARGGRAHGDRRGDPRRQDRPGHALEGQDGQLRDRLRAVGLRSRRPAPDRRRRRRSSSSTPTSSASPRSRQFIEDTIAQATTEGHVSTLFGRIRRVPELRSRQFQTRSLGERLAVNMVIQGTAADIIKVAMVRARDELRAAGLTTRLVLQIHDELLFEGPEGEVEQASEIVATRDGRGVRDGPAARGRRGRRRELAGGQVDGQQGNRGSGDGVRGRPRRDAGAGELGARQGDRQPAGGVLLVRRRAGRAGRDHARVAARGSASSARSDDLSWYYLIGGLLGAVYVTTVLISVRTLGAGGVTAATIAGQLILSVVLDKVGFLGLVEREITPGRIAGVVLLAAGVFLVVRS